MEKNWVVDLNNNESCRYNSCYHNMFNDILSFSVSDDNISFFIKRSGKYRNLLVLTEGMYYLLDGVSIYINRNENQVGFSPCGFGYSSGGYDSDEYKNITKSIQRDKKLKEIGI